MIKTIFLILTIVCMFLNGVNGLAYHKRLHKSEKLSNNEIINLRSYVFWSSLVWIMIGIDVIFRNF